MTYQPIHGVIVPTVTPMTDDGTSIRPDVMKPLADYLIAKETKGLFPLGTTGEGVLLTSEERKTLAEATVNAVDGRVPVIIHTGAITTADTIDLTAHAKSVGADAVAVIAPYYFGHSDEALIAHFEAVLDAVSDMPMYLYNFPGVSNNTLSLEVVTRLAKYNEMVVGLKDSSGDLQTLFATNRLQSGNFNTALGPDELILAGVSMGVDASVSGHANLVPEIVVPLYNATVAGNLDEAQEHQRKLNQVREVLASGGWLPVMKALLNERGIPVGGVRRPLLSPDDEVIQAAIRQLSALKVSLETVG